MSSSHADVRADSAGREPGEPEGAALAAVDFDFDDVDLARLERLHNSKWELRAPGAIGASVAETDFLPAPAIAEALRRAVADGDLGYGPADGGRLPAAFAGFAERHWGWRPDPASILPIPEVMVGVAELLRVLTAPGDGVVVEVPAYDPYFMVPPETGRSIVPVPLLTTPEGPRRDLDGLRGAFAAGARAMLLCNPHNPTGHLADAAELRAVAELAAEFGVSVIADEIWAPVVLDGTFTPFAPIAAGAPNPVMVVTSASKGFTVAGLKCALLLPATGAASAAMGRLPELLSHRTGLLGILASVAAFEDCDDWLAAECRYLRANRELLRGLLAECLPDVGYTPGPATYLAWLDFRSRWPEGGVAGRLDARAGVTPSDGAIYGAPGWARLNFGTSRALVRAMGAALARLR